MSRWSWLVALWLGSACVPPQAGPDGGQDAGLPDASEPDASTDGGFDGGSLDHGAPSSVYPAYPIDWPQLQGSDSGVLAQPRVVAITYDGDPLRGDIEGLFSAIGATEYWRVTTQEYGVGPAQGLPPIHLGGPAPALVDDNDIQTFLSNQLDAPDSGWPQADGQTVYALHYPEGTSVLQAGRRSCQSFGAYHSFFLKGGVTVAYAVMPRCAPTQQVPLLSTPLGTLTMVTTHELIEAVTDVDGTGYRSPKPSHVAFATFAGAETTDMCEFAPSAAIRSPELQQTVPRSWSNLEAKAGREPCVPAPAQAATWAVPVLEEMVPLSFEGAALTTLGVRLRRGESKTVPVLLVSSGPSAPFTISAIDRLQYLGRGQSLRLELDRTQGVNGEKVYLKMTRIADDPDFGGAMPFMIQGTLNGVSSTWFGAAFAEP